jgi:hypothetical protein
MRTFKTIRQATLSLAVDYERKVKHMFIEACKKDIFKNPIKESQYSTQWLQHHLYEEPKIKVFKMFLTVFPPKYPFKIKGFDEVFRSNKGE